MKGAGTSSGIGIGKAFIFKEPELKIEKKPIQNIEEELARFRSALECAGNELIQLYEYAKKNISENESEIFVAHKMMLEDPEFVNQVIEKITFEKMNSESAVYEVTNFYIEMFENIEDAYIKARAIDLKDVSKRLLRQLMGVETINLSTLKDKSIVIAHDLTPSDTAQMKKGLVAGIITELGGRTSHTSIIARTLEIPAIVGVEDATEYIHPGDELIINGDSGEIIVNPCIKEIERYTRMIEERETYKRKLFSFKSKKSLSKDGYQVEISGNIGSPKDIDAVIENGGEGVGLFRTEFLYMDRDRLPTEEEQFEAYRNVAEKLGDKPLVIRTLDVGGDKEIPYLKLDKESNPFLGYRAIRLCLDRKDIFETQIRAILKASAYGNVKIMFPMISDIWEVREAKALIENARNDLRNEGIPFNENMEIGIMVEIPAVAIHSESFAKEVDFFSIGTNDLIQYTLAVDRGNQKIARLYNQFHPSVLKLIKTTIENGHKAGIWVGMCGEAAGDPKMLPVLLAMGLDEFSMSATSILRTRHDLSEYSKSELENIVDKILELPTGEDVEKFICENLRV
ncbi:MAG: phosphoenolpyruvate--protein phosphotransferase [Tissierellales bacterium]|nr:phosphoenolpyruvate--protein phosphotransferase [Tissierellales bacterium]MBN2828088.1 phosphoenolpyruvate--protein phosphotransferase [Tissierellales bacterium]